MSRVLYVYAIGQGLSPQMVGLETTGVDGSGQFCAVADGKLSALCSRVDEETFSQEEIDRRSSDVAWLGEIGYHHQNVISAVARKADVIPLRAFTLFSSEQSLRDYLGREGPKLRKILDRIRGKEEWTLRLEFDPEAWSDALVRRVPSLRQLYQEAESSSAGRGYLLRKKLEEERKKAAKTAEVEVLQEIERMVADRLHVPAITETREERSGSFPQINLLLERTRADELRRMHQDMAPRYANDGVNLVLTGPWPPYSFATEQSHG